MNILVQENAAVRALYSGLWLGKVIFFLGLAFGFPAVILVSGWLAIPFAIYLSFFWVLGFQHMRITELTDEAVCLAEAGNPQVAFVSITKIFNLCPYDDDYHHLIILMRSGSVFQRVSHCCVPAGQGIIEHLKSHGVKVRNFWFWQEKD